ncbi:type IV secretory system conjugative DNA transfer family protein [Acidocella sp.]|uniref:type IV secretory system conjugative DNA transfer family protein n=1 Tax=Acidocella sp. TaxID=50710 RepID=UPI003D07A024
MSPLWAPLYLLKTILWMILAMTLIGLAGAGVMTDFHLDHSKIANTVFIVVTVIALLVAMVWGLTRPLLEHFGDRESGTHGTARFATEKETARLVQNKHGLLLGRDLNSGKLLRYAGPAHLLTMAPTRSGKGVGTIIPNLLTLDRSVICIDPKGENTRIAGRARGLFGKVHILDPFSVTGRVSASFNPLASLDAASLDVAEEAAILADALVYDPPAQVAEAHWNEEAKALIAGLILYIVAQEQPGRRSLATLREYLTAAPDAFADLLMQMQGTTAVAGLVARAANRHLGKDHREAAGVLSAAQRHTHFLDSPRMTAALGHSDFAFGDLKAETATVFLVLPPDRLGAYARWLRLMVTQSLQDMARATGRPAAPVLYLLDEFAALGHLAPVERAMGLMAGYGVQLWPILQDIHQLRANYGQSAGTFLSNAGVLQVFGVNDHDSARLVSDLLGQETRVFETTSRDPNQGWTNDRLTFSEQHTGRALLTPDEVRNMAQSKQLLFLTGQRPILARKLRYYADAEFAGKFDRP